MARAPVRLSAWCETPFLAGMASQETLDELALSIEEGLAGKRKSLPQEILEQELARFTNRSKSSDSSEDERQFQELSDRIVPRVSLAKVVRTVRGWRDVLAFFVPLGVGIVLAAILAIILRVQELNALEHDLDLTARAAGLQMDSKLAGVTMSFLGTLVGWAYAVHPVKTVNTANTSFDFDFDSVAPYLMDEAEFRRLIAAPIANVDVASAVGWNPVIPGALRSEYEAATGRPIRGVVSVSESGQANVGYALPAPFHVPVGLIEPLGPNMAALGFDIYSNAIRAAAVDASGLSGTLVSTAPISLVQEEEVGKFGVLVMLPVYFDPPNPNNPNNGNSSGSLWIEHTPPFPNDTLPEDVLKQVRGYMVMVVRAEKLLETDRLTETGMLTVVYDVTEPGKESLLLLRGLDEVSDTVVKALGTFDPSTGPSYAQVLNAQESARVYGGAAVVTVAQRKWQVRMLTGSTGLADSSSSSLVFNLSPLPWVVMTLVLIVTGGVFTLLVIGRRRIITRMAVSRYLWRLVRSFRLYVPQQLVAAVMENRMEIKPQQLETAEVTVLFTDIVGFTQIGEKVEPELLVQVLGEYFAAVSDAVQLCQGTIDKYVGDGVMAFFGAPSKVEDHAALACKAAVMMCNELEALRKEWARRGLPQVLQLRHRVGIHSGRVLVGNVGSATRVNYTLVGDTVNVASRLESLNRTYATEVICSGETWERVQQSGKTERFGRVKVLGSVALRGRMQETQVVHIPSAQAPMPGNPHENNLSRSRVNSVCLPAR